MDTERCAACQKPFVSRSRPRWAFTAEGRPAGRVHATCWLSMGHHYVGGDLPQAVAQFDLWASAFSAPYPERESDAWQAQFLTHLADESLSETLNAEQERRLRWWTVEGTLKLGAHREPGIRSAYTDLVRRFREWRDGLERAE